MMALAKIAVGVACGVLLAAAAVRAAPSSAASYLGVDTKSNSNVLEQAYAFSGITITRVVENSPGEVAGLKEGDILLRANGIELSHPDRLADVVERLPPGSRIRLRVERDRRVLELQATTVPRLKPATAAAQAGATAPADPSAALRIERRRLGIEFRTADRERLRGLGLESRGGVELVSLASRSPLLEAGLRPGDLLLELDGVSIPSADELLDFLAKLERGRELSLLAIDTAGARRELHVSTYQPQFQMTRLSVPPLFRIEREASVSRYSFLLGALRVERFETRSSYRLLWLLRLNTGSSGTLEPGDA
jgi:S1-C subfamily serine protease